MGTEILTDKLKESLIAIKSLKKELQQLKEGRNPIAVIGMGCRFPGNVNSPEEFWQLLINKKEGIVDIPAGRWDINELSPKYRSVPGRRTAKKGGFIDKIDQFDASFFGISPLEAEALDPQQRILLQTTWNAIESAGIPADNLKGTRTGVFIGISSPDYVHQRAASDSYEQLDIYDVTGNTPSTAAGRISYTFDLKGPAMAVDTACSSSLVTIHLACNSLRNRESDLAIAGGVNIMLLPNAHVIFSKMGALSAEGKCKTFDADADGFVRSEGCGIVVLKRLDDAKRDGDTILGVIKGTAINHDGRSNGLIAPNGLAQQEVLAQALADADMDPHEVVYIETHGTGTPLGDPIEIEAINHVYGRNRAGANPLYIGSVKTNLGHLESASGVAAFIKVILSLQHKCIPAHLNFKTPNPQIDWKDFLRVPVEPCQLAHLENKMAAGISAFGFSGTNAHLLVEEYTPPADTFLQNRTPIVLLSARSDNALTEMAGLYLTYLETNPAINLHQLSYSTATGRSHFNKRLAILPSSIADCQSQLKDFLHPAAGSSRFKRKLPDNEPPAISFLYTGQGSQYPGMGRLLYEQEPTFRKAVDECLDLLGEESPIRSFFHGHNVYDGGAAYDINQTQFAQPAIFILEYALTKLWQGLGIKPVALMGHSIGEVAAACCAKVFTLQDALKLILARGQLIQALKTPGKMVSVSATKAQVEQVIAPFDEISIAAINGEKSIVISGRADQMELAMHVLTASSVRVNMLQTSHAFHSGLMRPMLNEFKTVCQTITYRLPEISIISTVTGKNVSAEIAAPGYWVDHVIKPVLFYDGLRSLQRSGSNVFLELGPNPVLTNRAMQESGFENTVLIGGLSERQDDFISMASAIARLFVNGAFISWHGFFNGTRTPRLPIPCYPFQTKRFWIERLPEWGKTGNKEQRPGEQRPGHPFLGTATKIASEKDTYLWQTHFSLFTLPFLEDHQIEGAIVFPAACYMETAIAAVTQLTSSQQIELYDLSFEKVFVLNRTDRYELQTRMNRSGGVYRFDIYTRIMDQTREGNWIFRASGSAMVKETVPEELPDIEGIKTGAQHFTGAQFYQRFFAAGNHWKDSFKGIEEVWKRDTEILSLSRTPAAIRHQLKDFHSHPALMDICGQLLAANAAQDQQGAFVGKGIKKITVYGKLEGDEFWSYARVSGSGKNGTIEGDVRVYNAAGKLLAASTGVVFEFMDGKNPEVNPDRWIYSVKWEPAHTPNAPHSPSKIPAEKIEFLVMDQRPSPTDAWTSLPGHAVQQVHDIAGLTSALVNNQRILYIPPQSDQFDTLVLAIQDIAAMLKSITGHNGKDIKLWIITHQATNGPQPAKSLQSALWGLSKTIEIEQSNSWGGIIDIADTKFSIPEYLRIAAWIEANPADNQVQLAPDQVSTPRIVRGVISPNQPPEFATKAAYLITGGLGDLGLLTAQWMVNAGARRLILVNRSGLPPRAQWRSPDHPAATIKRIQKIKALENAGASIETVQLDISDEAAFSNWFNAYQTADLPEIRGVIHAAGTVMPGLFGEETPGTIAQQLAPKIKGTMTLHNVLGNKLDFFILFSSASAILHSPRLGIYAAANSFMDAFAVSRRAQGLPALSINWGPWKETDLVAEAMQDQHIHHHQQADQQTSHHQQIMDLIPPETGLRILQRCWHAPDAQLAVLPIHWERWKALFPAIAGSPYFQEVGPVRNTPTIDENDEASDRHAIFRSDYDDETIKMRLADYLIDKTTQLLRLKREEIDPFTSLADYGLDSMLAIEFKNRIETGLKISLPVIDLVNGPSIRQLADIITRYRYQTIAEDPLKPVVQEMVKNMPIGLSAGQQSLWTLHQMDPASAAYHIAFSAQIVNGLDQEKLQKALNIVLNRHAILRVRFKETNGTVYQFIPPDEDFRQWSMEVTDVAGLSDDEVLKKMRAAYEKPFNLAEDTAVRAHLFDQGKDSYVLLLTLHHLVSDGWSLWILLEEINKAYSNLVDELPVQLPDNSYSYVDFIAWQKKFLAGELGQKMLDSWSTKLKGTLPVLQLPVDHPRIAAVSGKTYRFDVDSTMAARLRKFAREETLTLNMCMMGLFKILLYRYTGAEDLIIGSPTSGRSRTEFAEVVGDFINLVAIRTYPKENMSMKGFLLGVKMAVLEALANQDFPFADLIRKLNPQREIGRTPVFQVLFSMQKPQKFHEIIALLEGNEVSWGKLTLRPYSMPQQEGQFDLTLELIENSNGIAGIFKYNDQLFELSTITRMQEHYLHLVQTLIDNPDQLLSRISLNPKEVTRAALSWWHGPDLPLPAKVIHQLIDEQALRSPGAVALVCGEDTVTYAELLRKVDGLASQLVESGIKRHDKVGLCIDRSIDMVIAMVAVLKTGAPYVPLDPNFPEERIGFITNDSGIGHLIVQTAHIPLFKTFTGKIIDAGKAICHAHQQPVNSLPAVSLSDVAYIIYTSGSSGKPKGTVITHANLINFCLGMNQVLGTQKGTLLAVTTISFDIAVLELLWTLTNGFKIVIQSDDTRTLTTHSSGEASAARTMDFSLFYFSSADEKAERKYQLLIDGAKYADTHGFKAVWTPERHLHKFGGLFPNPSVTSAALSTITSHIELRAGSVVTPLHNPLRIAEEWSVVDNLSNGRVAVAFASGWQANDFILSPGIFEQRYQRTKENIEIVRQLWAGKEVSLQNAGGNAIACRLFPRPVQPELPIWITTAGNIDTFKHAGAMGANVLTHLLTQTTTELKEKIAAYKKARQENGFDPESGKITIMLHAFIGASMDEVKQLVYEPFTDYLRSSFDLMKNMAMVYGIDADSPEFAAKGIEAMMPRAFERYFNTASLMGTVDHCQIIVDALYETGVTEIGCLIDFGVAYEHTMASLEKIAQLKDRYQRTKRTRVYSVAENIKNHAVTHLQSTPSLLRMLLSDPAARNEFFHIKKLLIGGEKLPPALVNDIQNISGTEIFNMYGPTETTVWSSVQKIEKGDGMISIGQPICNTRYYVLDRFLEPVREGVTGELYIGGKGVSAGYLGQPALTKERFINNPFDDNGANQPTDDGGVLYRTGDLVRFNATHQIEYVERADLQVKINGHRIEIGEVEFGLARIGSVGECAVIHSDGRLVAYLVAKEKENIDLESVRSALKKTLPAYMIPKFFRVIDRMPLTPNAKIDRRKLMQLSEQKMEEGSAFVAPESPMEKELVTIWQDLLGVTPIGVENNFFEVGGDSILSVQLAAKAKEHGLQLSVNQLFQHQTIRELAKVVKRAALPTQDQGKVTGFHTLTPIQHWFFGLQLNNLNHYNQAFMLTLPGNTNLAHLERALAYIIQHHDVLRSRFRQVDTNWQQVYDAGEMPAFAHIDLRPIGTDGQEAFIREHASKTQASLDLLSGDLFRAVIYSGDEHDRLRLLMVAHHLVIDGYSWRIIFGDLNLLLQQQLQQKSMQLFPKTTSYKAWSDKLNGDIIIPFLNEQRTYWSNRRNGYNGNALHTITFDKDLADRNTVGSTKTISVTLSSSDSKDILGQLPKAYNIKINELLLAALYRTLTKWSHTNEVYVDVEGHGREDIWADVDVSRTVGWFTTIMPLKLSADDNENEEALLQRMKDLVRNAPANAVGYGILKYLSDRGEDKIFRQMERPAVLFNYLGQFQMPVKDWEYSGSDIGFLYDPAGCRSHLLEIIGMHAKGQFSFQWNYSDNIHTAAEIKRAADDFVKNLLTLRDYCMTTALNGFTAADFPQARINNIELEKLMLKFK